MKQILRFAIVALTWLPSLASAQPGTQAGPVVSRPPEAFFESLRAADRDVARQFYAKYLDISGLSVTAAATVDDAARLRTHELVSHLLAGRPDVLGAMARRGTRLIIIGKDQVYTDMPEYRRESNPTYMNERVRGTGGFGITSFGEENLLNLPIDRYDDESIAVHEFCHTIDAALKSIDPDWTDRLDKTYQHAIDRGRWHLTYTGSNRAEYWAEICQCYFDCNRVNNWNHGPIGTREQLKDYDPEGYDLVRTMFKLTAQTDWRFTPVRRAPSVIAPPAKFGIDPYYTKFSYARELPVVGSDKVSDAALLRANLAVRKLFAYRHDVLKAIINDGARLVVLGRSERLADLPELRAAAAAEPAWDNARYLDYTSKIMVVPEENVLGEPSDPLDGASSVVRVMARTAYALTASRPVDPDWESRSPRVWQQYELRLQRLDSRLKDRLQGLSDQAAAKQLWLGTPGADDLMKYWSAGVEAYFDAAGVGVAPVGADRPIVTRQALADYDPGLYELVDQTFAYRQRADWRFKAPDRP